MSEENKTAVLGQFVGKCCDSTVFNNNDMHLSKELFKNVISSDEYKDAIDRGHYIGFLGHPEDPGCQEFKDACIVMKEMHINSDDEIEGTFDLVNTPVGQVVKSFMDAGVKFGISIRGAGDVDGEGEVDPETFVFRGFDLVAFPAYNDCVPEFQAIAASEDLEAKRKYKKVCATVKRNIKKITACNTLEIIQDQFRPDTAEYDAIQDQIDSLSLDEVEPEIVITDPNVEKLNGVTNLYIEKVNEVNELKAQIATFEAQVAELQALNQAADTNIEAIELACSRKIARAKRIMSSQMTDLNTRLDSVKNSYRVSVAANNALKSELSDVRASQQALETKLKNTEESSSANNLKYRQKITSATETISAKDNKIAELESKLRETVAATSEASAKTSNLEAKIKHLNSKVTAADSVILNYQQAYANLYANALGVCVNDLPITASTTVKELQEMIQAGCNTANMSTVFVEPQPVDIIDSDESDESDLVTM